MAKLWDDLKQNMKEWSTVAVEKAEEVSKLAVAKTEELTKISKIKIEIHQLQKERTRNFEKLGRLVHQQAQKDNMVNFTGNAEFFNFVEKINENNVSLDNKDTEIEHIKDSYNISETEISPDSPIKSDPKEAGSLKEEIPNPEESKESSDTEK